MKASETFQQLEAYLREKGYEWVITQVGEEISAGKIVEEHISTLAESRSANLGSQTDYRKGAVAEFVRRAEYTEADKLVLLLEASRRAVLDANAMAVEIERSFADSGVVKISFHDEAEPEARLTLNVAEKGEIEDGQLSKFGQLIQRVRSEQ